MQGRDGEPPKAVRTCGRARGEAGGGVYGELGRWSSYCAGWRSLQRREKDQKENRGESHGGCFVVGWLTMVELVFVVVYSLGLLVFSPKKAAVAEVERERKKNKESCRNREEAIFFFVAYFGPQFLLPQIMKSTFIYRQWKRAILSTEGKIYSP